MAGAAITTLALVLAEEAGEAAAAAGAEPREGGRLKPVVGEKEEEATTGAGADADADEDEREAGEATGTEESEEEEEKAAADREMRGTSMGADALFAYKGDGGLEAAALGIEPKG